MFGRRKHRRHHRMCYWCVICGAEILNVKKMCGVVAGHCFACNTVNPVHMSVEQVDAKH